MVILQNAPDAIVLCWAFAIELHGHYCGWLNFQDPMVRRAGAGLDDDGRRSVERVAFHVPARCASTPGTRAWSSFGHLAQAVVDAHDERHVEQTDAVAARLTGLQVRGELGEPGGVVHLGGMSAVRASGSPR